MSKIARILAALLILAALMGADKSCERVDTNRPPDEHQVDPAQKRTVKITANSRGPYTILVIATDGKGGLDRYGPRHIAAGEFTQTLDYETGARLEVKVSVRGHRADDMACSIADGPNIERQRKAGEAVCLLTTSR